MKAEQLSQADIFKNENKLKYTRDLKGVVDTAFEEGRMEGRIEGKMETAISLLSLGVHIDTIVKATGLTKDQIENSES